MDSRKPPTIFSASRKAAAQRRRAALQLQGDAASYVLDDMAEDAIDRLSFMQLEPQRALVIGDWTGAIARHLQQQGSEVTATNDGFPNSERFDEAAPYPSGGYDLIVSLARIDTVNDLPGALIHMRQALAAGGFALASFVGAGSLPKLRAAMLAADADRPAARMHPMVDVRAGAELMQRALFAKQVVDGHRLNVRYSNLLRLVSDLREQGLGNVLAGDISPLSRAAFERANKAFADQADADGKIAEQFEIVTLSGWKD